MAAAKKKVTAKKKANGRPRFIIDYDLVYKLAKRFETQEGIAEVLGCSASTLQHDMKFLQAFKRGKELCKKNLRVAQYKYALRGNSTLLIWLGKQYLGQSDNRNEIESPDDIAAMFEQIAKQMRKSDKGGQDGKSD